MDEADELSEMDRRRNRPIVEKDKRIARVMLHCSLACDDPIHNLSNPHLSLHIGKHDMMSVPFKSPHACDQ